MTFVRWATLWHVVAGDGWTECGRQVPQKEDLETTEDARPQWLMCVICLTSQEGVVSKQ